MGDKLGVYDRLRTAALRERRRTMKKQSEFFCYRYFVTKNQKEMFDDSVPFMDRIIEACKTRKIEIEYQKGKRLGLIYIKELGKNIVLLKQYKETHLTMQRFNSSEKDIISVEADSLPFIYVIIAKDEQFVLFQKKHFHFPK